MPESFADLLQIHGADATLWEELNRPLAVYITPRRTPIPTTQHDDQLNMEESVLEVCASPQFSLEEEPAVVTAEEARLADMIPRTKEVSISRS